MLAKTPDVLEAVVLGNGFLHLRILPRMLHRCLHPLQPKLAPLLWLYPHLPWVARQLGLLVVLWSGERIFLHREPHELKRRMFWGYTITTDVSMVLRLQAALQYAAPPDLSQARVPTLVVSSGHDHWLHLSEARQLAKLLPCAEQAILPSAGHMSPMVEPDAFNAVALEFLGRMEGRVL